MFRKITVIALVTIIFLANSFPVSESWGATLSADYVVDDLISYSQASTISAETPIVEIKRDEHRSDFYQGIIFKAELQKGIAYDVSLEGGSGQKIIILDANGFFVDDFHFFIPEKNGTYYFVVSAGMEKLYGNFVFNLKQGISGASISGKVTDDAGNAIKGISVQLMSDNYSWFYRHDTKTDKNGKYVINVRVFYPGTYRLRFYDWGDSYEISDKYKYRFTYAGNHNSYYKADVISLSGKQSIKNLNVKLAKKGSYSAATTVKKLPYTGKGEIALDTREIEIRDKTAESGFFRAQVYNVKLKKGKWILIGATGNVLKEHGAIAIFNSKGELLSYCKKEAFGYDVGLTFKPKTTGIYQVAVATRNNADIGEFTLQAKEVKTGAITGIVKGYDYWRSKIQGVYVTAFLFDKNKKQWTEIKTVITNKSGRYILDGLTAGKYRIKFWDWEYEEEGFSGFITKYYGSKKFSKAKQMTVKAGKTIENINVRLDFYYIVD